MAGHPTPNGTGEMDSHLTHSPRQERPHTTKSHVGGMQEQSAQPRLWEDPWLPWGDVMGLHESFTGWREVGGHEMSLSR